MTTRAVVLARGLGTRMRQADAAAQTTGAQAAIAATGIKALIPIDRPFLDYGLSALADAGITDVCLVIGPEHDAVRRHYHDTVSRRLRLAFAVQAEPSGTADAVLAAERWTAGQPFLVINSDNYYPVAALERLVRLEEPGLVGFTRAGLLNDGLIESARIARFGIVEADADDRLVRVLEKPDPRVLAAADADALVSMNCWRFDARIFDACRQVPRSERGEQELPQAVQLALQLGVAFRTVRFSGGVLDLSSRADISNVTARLRGVEVRL